jgi:hypothetical protein
MRIFIFILFVCSIIFGCKKNDFGQPEIIPAKYDSIVNHFFIENNSNYLNNNIVRQEAVQEFVPVFDSLINLYKVEDFEFKVLSIDKTKNEDYFNLNLYVNSCSSYKKPKLKFNLIGKVHKSIAHQINESENYRVYCNNFYRLSEKELFDKTRLVYYENYPFIESYSDFILGSFSCEIDSLSTILNTKVIK